MLDIPVMRKFLRKHPDGRVSKLRCKPDPPLGRIGISVTQNAVGDDVKEQV